MSTVLVLGSSLGVGVPRTPNGPRCTGERRTMTKGVKRATHHGSLTMSRESMTEMSQRLMGKLDAAEVEQLKAYEGRYRNCASLLKRLALALV